MNTQILQRPVYSNEDQRATLRCPQCGSAKLPHAACDNCGYVNPKLALQVEEESE